MTTEQIPSPQPAHEGYSPAFPTNTANEGNDGACYPNYGMSLRDYFAAKALAGMLADSNFDHPPETAATLCYAMADAMLKARTA